MDYPYRAMWKGLVEARPPTFSLVLTRSNRSPDALVLYDEENKVLFGGNTLLGDSFLIRDLRLLEQDLERASRLDVEWHSCSHGPQRIEVMRSGFHLSVIRRMVAGERSEGTTRFSDRSFPLYELDGVEAILTEEFLTY